MVKHDRANELWRYAVERQKPDGTWERVGLIPLPWDQAFVASMILAGVYRGTSEGRFSPDQIARLGAYLMGVDLEAFMGLSETERLKALYAMGPRDNVPSSSRFN